MGKIAMFDADEDQSGIERHRTEGIHRDTRAVRAVRGGDDGYAGGEAAHHLPKRGWVHTHDWSTSSGCARRGAAARLSLLKYTCPRALGATGARTRARCRRHAAAQRIASLGYA